MRWIIALAFITLPAWAQDKAAPKKKTQQVAHKKATPEQIRKFNDLAKKRAK